MHIALTFTLSTGGDYKNPTSDFATLDECKQRLAHLVGQGASTLAFDEPDGSKTVIATRHIVALEIAPAGGR